MKKENTKRPKKGNLEENCWIDIHNDDVMREMGLIRSYVQVPRDKSVWTKTPYEKRILKKYRHSCKKDMHFHAIPRKPIRVRSKLIINLLKNKQFSKTTYSIECWQHEIPEILAKFQIVNRKAGYSTSVVRKYSWNGRTYGPTDLPYRG